MRDLILTALSEKSSSLRSWQVGHLAVRWSMCLLVLLVGGTFGCKEEHKKLLKPNKITLRPEKGRVIILGDSLTAGFGVDPSEAFPALLQKRADEAEFKLEVVAAGVSGDTSAGGVGRLDWVLSQPVDIFVLALGGNDALRGLSPEEMEANLQRIISTVRDKNPKAEIVLLGMEAPPNLGLDYRIRFREAFSRLAAKNKVTFVPFFLHGVAGVRSLNLTDGVHPNPEGHQRIAQYLWPTLEPIFRARGTNRQ